MEAAITIMEDFWSHSEFPVLCLARLSLFHFYQECFIFHLLEIKHAEAPMVTTFQTVALNVVLISDPN